MSKPDHLVGIRDPTKKDFFAGCNEPGTPTFQPNPHDFMQVWCNRCKQAACIRAKGVVEAWETRMDTQVEYLINNPKFSDMTSLEHQELAKKSFQSLKAKAERLELAAKTQNWSIPDLEAEYDLPTDGVNRIIDPTITEKFDETAKSLAKATGKQDLDLPPMERSTTDPAYFQAPSPETPPEEEYEYDTQYPSSDGKRHYHVTLSKAGQWACECDGFKYKRKCKHLDIVRDWYDDQLRIQAQEQAKIQTPVMAQPKPPVAPQPKPPVDSRVPEETRLNTPIPTQGIMIGGGPPAEPQEHPWSPRKDRVVESGAKIVLKRNPEK